MAYAPDPLAVAAAVAMGMRGVSYREVSTMDTASVDRLLDATAYRALVEGYLSSLEPTN